MYPIAIFQFSTNVEPGYFASFLNAQGISSRLFRIDQGETVPDSPDGFGGVCLMGGEMSVNDPLPWIPDIQRLIRQAVAANVPVIGHCLGGQLLAKALGGSVSRNQVPEIGWGRISVAHSTRAQEWLGDIVEFPVFQWHNETFSLPEGAELLMSSPHCTNQAFAIGPHLGMQCHVEMTEALIARWNAEGTVPAEGQTLSVQPSEQQLAQTSIKLPAMRIVAQRLYERWLENVRRA